MNKYVIYTLVFVAGVVLANRVKAIPVVGPMIPQV